MDVLIMKKTNINKNLYDENRALYIKLRHLELDAKRGNPFNKPKK
jgi:hypothetical protein